MTNIDALKDELTATPGNGGDLDAPWRIVLDDDEGITVLDANGQVVWVEEWSFIPQMDTRKMVMKQVQLRVGVVVRAVNAHADLLADLKDILPRFERLVRTAGETEEIIDIALARYRDTIFKAEGKTS